LYVLVPETGKTEVSVLVTLLLDIKLEVASTAGCTDEVVLLPYFEDASAVEKPPFVLDVTLWILEDSVLVDMLGNTLEAKLLLVTELELAASNFVVYRTSNTAKPPHNRSIRILILPENGNITFSGSSGLVVQLFVHSEIKYDRCFQAVLRPPFP